MKVSASTLAPLFGLDQGIYLDVVVFLHLLEDLTSKDHAAEDAEMLNELEELLETVKPNKREELLQALKRVHSAACFVDSCVEDFEVELNEFELGYIDLINSCDLVLKVMAKLSCTKSVIGSTQENLRIFCEVFPTHLAKTLLFPLPEWQAALGFAEDSRFLARDGSVSLFNEKKKATEGDFHRLSLVIPESGSVSEVTVKIPYSSNSGISNMEETATKLFKMLSDLSLSPESNNGDCPQELTCSFCNKGQSEVGKLVAGPSASICNFCVDQCSDICAEEIK
jgi:hypothetical protein